MDKLMRLMTLAGCAALWAVTRILFLPRRLRPIPKEDIKRVVVLAWGGIGNVILLTPLLKNIRKAFPSADISVIVNPNGSGDALEGSPWVDHVIVKQDTGLKDIKHKAESLKMPGKTTVFFCMVGIDPIVGTLYSFYSGMEYRVGERGHFEGFLYTHAIKVEPKEHEVERNLGLLRALKFPVADEETAFWVPDETKAKVAGELDMELGALRQRSVAMAPGSGKDQAFKRWPKGHFAEVAKWFVKKNFNVLLVGDKDEKMLCEEIKKACPKGVYNMAGRWPLKGTAAAISLSRMMVTNDSGLMHVASAFKIPVVAVFGPTLPYKNAPWNSPSRIVRTGIDCSPCYNFRKFSCPRGIKCLAELRPEEVIRAIAELDKETKCLQ